MQNNKFYSCLLILFVCIMNSIISLSWYSRLYYIFGHWDEEKEVEKWKEEEETSLTIEISFLVARRHFWPKISTRKHKPRERASLFFVCVCVIAIAREPKVRLCTRLSNTKPDKLVRPHPNLEDNRSVSRLFSRQYRYHLVLSSSFRHCHYQFILIDYHRSYCVNQWNEKDTNAVHVSIEIDIINKCVNLSIDFRQSWGYAQIDNEEFQKLVKRLIQKDWKKKKN